MSLSIVSWTKTELLGVALGVAALTGCTAAVGGQPGQGTSVGPASSGSGGASGSNGGSVGGAAVTATDPGRVTMHRLNLAEYDNTMRDLLGTKTHPSVDFKFPVDDRGSDFDNTSDVLSVSPLHLSSYNAAASALIAAALASPAQRALLVSCDLSTGAECARTALAAFVPRAWRREVSTAEIDQLMSIVALATSKGDQAEVGFALALRAVLLSSYFVFRPEVDPSPASLTPHALGEYELASRLSYFLWSSMPDAPLFAAAKAGTLHEPAQLAAQISRMLADPKAQALVENFAGQWLLTRLIDDAQPDTTLFPGFDVKLRDAFKAESEMLFHEVAFNGLPADQLLTANFTFANDRLAKFYGLPPVGSDELKRVDLSGNSQRRGLLTQGGILTVNAHGDRTSPVKRGKFVLNALLCTDIPPPPPTVNTTIAPDSSGQKTLRQVLSVHLTGPVCSSCHSLMDPIGFGMENYDAIGAYRTTDNQLPVDATGTLPTTGQAFNGLVELTQLIAKNPAFPSCVASKLYTYALGRGLVLNDPKHLDPSALSAAASRFSGSGLKFQELVAGVVNSPTFLNRRGEGGGS